MVRLLAVFLVACPSLLLGCSCVNLNSTGCDKGWNSGEVVFLGKVTAVEETGDHALFMSKAVRFSLTENYKGTPPENAEIVIHTGSGGGDCGYPFVVGVSYLVFASTFEGYLSTGICSETVPEAMAGGVLKELRSLRDARGRLDDLFGTLLQSPVGNGWESLVSMKPLERVVIEAFGKHKTTFSATTDAQGVFAFASLPPDQYRIEVHWPAGLSAKGNQPAADSFPIEVGQEAGCRVDAFAAVDGRVSGVVVDAQTGKALAGFVTIEPMNPKERQEAMRQGGLPGDDTEDGAFELPQLPEGEYRLVFHPKDRLYQSYYWPNDSTTTGIKLAFGQHLEHVRFEVKLNP